VVLSWFLLNFELSIISISLLFLSSGLIVIAGLRNSVVKSKLDSCSPVLEERKSGVGEGTKRPRMNWRDRGALERDDLPRSLRGDNLKEIGGDSNVARFSSVGTVLERTSGRYPGSTVEKTCRGDQNCHLHESILDPFKLSKG